MMVNIVALTVNARADFEFNKIRRTNQTISYHINSTQKSTTEHITSHKAKNGGFSNVDNEMLVLVMSRRTSFETRRTIRKTWGKNSVRFVVGTCCLIPPLHVMKWTCTLDKTKTMPTETSIVNTKQHCLNIDSQLKKEQQEFRDMIFAPTIDVYRHLPQKLKAGYAWAIENSSALWIVKTDDDSVIRIKQLNKHLREMLDASAPTVYGHIAREWRVHRTGKWAEHTYKPSKYPLFPLGSHGHVVSRPIAHWISDNQNSLINYQGEDVSVGIWLDSSPFKRSIQWVHSKHSANHGNCFDTALWMIGHDISAEKMKKCFRGPKKPVSIVPEIVDVRTILLSHRFDIIIKTVYASFFVTRKPVPRFVTAMYDRHLEVWNHFQEPCKFLGDEDWVDSQRPCVKKTSAEDFRTSFQTTIQSIRSKGVDANISLVPVTKTGFPLNGAHRIATVIALGKKTMPIQRAKKQHTFNWGFSFFQRKSMESKYTDFAMLEWAFRFPTTTVVVWPRATAMTSKLAKTRAIVSNEIGEILYETTLSVTIHGLESLVLHAYGKQPWLTQKVSDLVGTESVLQIRVMFLNTPSVSAQRAKSAKEKIRKYYGIFKSSVHVSDTSEEAAMIAEMVLNSNSKMYLNKHNGSACSVVANEIAVRLNVGAVMPSLFLLPQTIMVDSGAVMSFFGLRPRTDVDILFLESVNQRLLGNQNGISIEPHTFATTNRGQGKWKWGQRNWGQEHLNGTNAIDFFYNPKNYGFCYGLKFVSLSQLARYKALRGEKDKDDRDVTLINDLIFRVSDNAIIQRERAQAKIWVCPTAWYFILARSLFDKHVSLLQPTSSPSQFDILLRGVGEPKCSKFLGTTLIMNCESSAVIPRANNKTFFIGPYGDSPRSIQVYGVAHWYTYLRSQHPEYFDEQNMPRRLRNSGKHFMIYIARNCVSFRDDAYLHISNLMLNVVHLGGACPTQKKIARVAVPPRSKREKNPLVFARYRFVLCMENKNSQGYITEKILSAMISGAIPIYYGTKEVFKLFNKHAFIYYDVNNPKPALERIKYLETNASAYSEVVSRPILANGKKTLEDFFSLSSDIGKGKLKQRIKTMMFGSDIGKTSTSLRKIINDKDVNETDRQKKKKKSRLRPLTNIVADDILFTFFVNSVDDCVELMTTWLYKLRHCMIFTTDRSLHNHCGGNCTYDTNINYRYRAGVRNMRIGLRTQWDVTKYTASRLFETMMPMAFSYMHTHNLKLLVRSDADTWWNRTEIERSVDIHMNSMPVALGRAYRHTPCCSECKLSCLQQHMYLTGGAGVILNIAAVERLAKMIFTCPKPTHGSGVGAGEDLWFGKCMYKLNIKMHSVPKMHQRADLTYHEGDVALSIHRSASYKGAVLKGIRSQAYYENLSNLIR